MESIELFALFSDVQGTSSLHIGVGQQRHANKISASPIRRHSRRHLAAFALGKLGKPSLSQLHGLWQMFNNMTRASVLIPCPPAMFSQRCFAQIEHDDKAVGEI
jgi:hypothetical protein